MVHDGSHGLINITPDIEKWLTNIGVETAQEFNKLGAKKVYLLLLEAGHEPNDELRCRLLGAEQELDWHIIAQRDSTRAKSRFADIDEA